MMLNEYYLRLVQGKSILVVGPGAHRVIDKRYDLHVCINTHWKPADGRLNILYSACPSNPEKVLGADHLKFVWLDSGQPNYRLWRTACEQRRLPHASYRREYSRTGYTASHSSHWVIAWQKEYNFIPLSGVLAVKHLTFYPVNSIYVTGMDFYASASPDSSVPDWRGPFEMRAQMQAMRDLMAVNPHLSVDSWMEQILQSNQKD